MLICPPWQLRKASLPLGGDIFVVIWPEGPLPLSLSEADTHPANSLEMSRGFGVCGGASRGAGGWPWPRCERTTQCPLGTRALRHGARLTLLVLAPCLPFGERRGGYRRSLCREPRASAQRGSRSCTTEGTFPANTGGERRVRGNSGVN